MVRERLEELEVFRLERADVAQGVGHEERADERRLAGERRDQRLAAVPACRAVRSFDRRQVDEPRLALGDGTDQDRIIQRESDRLHHHDRVAGPDLTAQDLIALMARQKADLGHIGPEHLSGVLEQRHDRGIELRAALEDPGRLEEQFDALVLLAFGDVRAIGESRSDGRQDEQPGRSRVVPEDSQAHEREACVRQGDDDADLEHLAGCAGTGRSPRPARSLC